MAAEAVVGGRLGAVMFFVEENARVGRGVTAGLPIGVGLRVTGAAGFVEGGDVLAAEMRNLTRIAGEMLDDAAEVGLDGVDVEGERAAMAVAAVHGAMRRRGPIGMDVGHFVAGRTGLLRVAKMEIREPAERARRPDPARRHRRLRAM